VGVQGVGGARDDRAEALLPRPLATNRIDVAVALEMLRWQRA
jgi:hypothetical protein